MTVRNKRFLIAALFALVAFGLFNLVTNSHKPSAEIAYSDFIQQVTAGQILNAEIDGNQIKGQQLDGKSFQLTRPEDPQLIPLLRKHSVQISAKSTSMTPWYMVLLIEWGPFLLLFGLMIFWFRRMQSGGSKFFSIGKSKAKQSSPENSNVTFADVAGVEEAKEDLEEIVNYLKEPKKYEELGGKIPKGVLLIGPPGTGKTLLAKAVAGEANAPFFSISGSDFVEMFVGVGASRVRDMFEEARKNAPCILFIDEIDAVGRHRGTGMGNGHDEREQTLNQLLVEMDGFGTEGNVIVLAATNRVDILDPALLRPGRFDRSISVPLPDLPSREQILAIHATKVKLDPEVSLDKIAKGTQGFSGADLRNLINESALYAARCDLSVVGQNELEWARDRILMGAERKSMVVTEKERTNTAYHEAGHAVLGILLENSDPVHKVTIVPRGQAMGVTSFLPTEEVYSQDKEKLVTSIMVAMGGRAAEEVIFGERTTGASNDIMQATKMARNMVTRWGMSQQFGPLALDGEEQTQYVLGRELGTDRTYSEQTAEKIDHEVSSLLNDCYKKAKNLLEQHRNVLDQLARTLVEKETVGGDEIKQMLGMASSQPQSAAG